MHLKMHMLFDGFNRMVKLWPRVLYMLFSFFIILVLCFYFSGMCFYFSSKLESQSYFVGNEES